MRTNRYFGGALLSVAILGAAASSCARSDDQAELKAAVQRLADAAKAKDINAIMAYYVPDDSLFVFDALPPRQYVGAAAYRKDWEGFLAAYPGPIQVDVTDWAFFTEGNLGYGHGVFRTAGPGKDGKTLDLTLRVTDVYRKIDGKWLTVHEHVSWPVDLATGQADLSSKP
jgi:ketosteroid isomerase-like protein